MNEIDVVEQEDLNKVSAQIENEKKLEEEKLIHQLQLEELKKKELEIEKQ